jgi:multiple sugar transport system substrate-binding protein
MKKSGLILLFLVTAVLLFAGGGQDSGSGETSGGRVTLKFTYWGSPVEKKAVENSIAEFEKKNSGIKVDAQHIPTDYLPKITAMVAGNVAPDIAYLSGQVANEWGAEGKLVNVLELYKNDPDLKAEDFVDDVWYKWSADAAVGTNTALETYALFYNKDLFLAENIELPPAKPEEAWTWDKFVQIAKKLTKDNTGKHPDDPGFNPDNIVQYGVQWGTTLRDYTLMAYSNGGRFLTEDGKKLALTQPEALEAIQKLADLINVHHVCPSPAAVKNIPEVSTALQTSRVAMVVTGQWVLLDLAANRNLNFDIGVLPKHKEYKTVLIGSPSAIFNSTKNQKESWALFKWFANPESSLELIQAGLWMPLLKKWYTDETLIAKWAQGNRAHPPSYRTAVMEAAIKYGVAEPVYNVRNYSKLLYILNPALDPVWLGRKTAEQALKEVEAQINNEVQGFYDSSRNY